ncbi:MAG: hypothetical protein PHW60_16060 [Kiritimatiellae bacterium]|nr:hypothetical protein [Kiritimatiellia bacterium]
MATGILDAICVTDMLADSTALFMQAWLGLPDKVWPALLSGFLRKELAIGMLVSLELSPARSTIAGTVFVLFRCIVALVAMINE